MDIATLVNITSKAWALPILAALSEGTPARQASLLTATGASRTAFAQSMHHLIETGLLERNPGHGHPLRPEFRLTELGLTAAPLARAALAAVSPEAQPLLRRTWTVPVLACLERPKPFSEIKRGLPNITDRALSQSLRAMEENAWVTRQIQLTDRRPHPLYAAANAGALITDAARGVTFATTRAH